MTQTQTTDIVGFFNPNSFPIVLDVSELNQKIQLEPNAFIEDDNKIKINDPIFKGYCRPNCLAIEMSKTDNIPLRIIARPEAVKDTPYSYQGTEQFLTDGAGNIISATMPPQNVQAPSNQNPMGQFSIEEAIKLGLIKPPGRMVEDDPNAPEDTETGVVAKPKPLAAPGLTKVINEEVKFNPEASLAEISNRVALAHVAKPIVAAQPIIAKLSPTQVVTEAVITTSHAKPEPVREERRRRMRRNEKAPQATPVVVVATEAPLPEAEV